MKISVQHTRFNSPLSRIADLLTCAAEADIRKLSAAESSPHFQRLSRSTSPAAVTRLPRPSHRGQTLQLPFDPPQQVSSWVRRKHPKPPLPATRTTSTGLSVTGMVGAQVVALDADTGAIVAAAFSSRSCNGRVHPRNSMAPTIWNACPSDEITIYTPSRWWTSLFRLTSTSREICVRRM
jgi:hypothetical protein